jgi:hypothetical protein
MEPPVFSGKGNNRQLKSKKQGLEVPYFLTTVYL